MRSISSIVVVVFRDIKKKRENLFQATNKIDIIFIIIIILYLCFNIEALLFTFISLFPLNKDLSLKLINNCDLIIYSIWVLFYFTFSFLRNTWFEMERP